MRKIKGDRRCIRCGGQKFAVDSKGVCAECRRFMSKASRARFAALHRAAPPPFPPRMTELLAKMREVIDVWGREHPKGKPPAAYLAAELHVPPAIALRLLRLWKGR